MSQADRPAAERETSGSPPPITELLRDAEAGRAEALDELFGLVHAELRSMAERVMRPDQRRGTLQATALVNEAFLKLFGGNPASFQDRRHFFAKAATAMRSILVDYSRYRNREKRHSDGQRLVLEQLYADFRKMDVDLLTLGEALDDLRRLDERMVQVVELHLICRYSKAEVAEILGVSKRTVERDWEVAKAKLAADLREED